MFCVIRGKVFRRLIACAAKAFLFLAMLTAAAETANAMIVTHDMGGSVRERLSEVESLRASGTEVRIVGTCVSACTLLLGVPTTCVTPSARLGFHGPSTRRNGLPLPRAEYERVSLQMAQLYPPRIREWFMSKARKVTGDYILMSGRDAIAMGARACN